MVATKITTYGPAVSGGRRRSFDIDGVTVIVEPHENDEHARRVAEFLADATRQVDRLAAENRDLRASGPPATPARLLGPGVVRMRNGEVWLLNRAETGWASFGVRCNGWDDLFRRYDVIVTGYDRDETGDYWTVDNTQAGHRLSATHNETKGE